MPQFQIEKMSKVSNRQKMSVISGLKNASVFVCLFVFCSFFFFGGGGGREKNCQKSCELAGLLKSNLKSVYQASQWVESRTLLGRVLSIQTHLGHLVVGVDPHLT